MKRTLLSLAVFAAAAAALADSSGVTQVTGSPTLVEFTNWVAAPGRDPAEVAPFVTSTSSTYQANFAYGNNSGTGTGQVAFQATLLHDFATAPNVNFVAGYLQAYNGSVGSNTSVGSVTLQMHFVGDLYSASGPAQPWAQTLSTEFNIKSTANAGIDPFADADGYYFTGFEDRTFFVFEGQSATVEILLNYDDLTLQGFGNVVSGGGYVRPLNAVPESLGWTPLPAFAAVMLLGARFRRRRD